MVVLMTLVTPLMALWGDWLPCQRSCIRVHLLVMAHALNAYLWHFVPPTTPTLIVKPACIIQRILWTKVISWFITEIGTFLGCSQSKEIGIGTPLLGFCRVTTYFLLQKIRKLQYTIYISKIPQVSLIEYVNTTW